MATDICDKQLKDLRNKRWDRAFKIKPDASADELAMSPEVMENDVNRKATIVIEHLMQASDVSHTMQHFNGMACHPPFQSLLLFRIFSHLTSSFPLRSLPQVEREPFQ